jgi:chaperone required for assembly of F1-ATPase
MPITQEDFELKKVRDYITSLELDFLTALYLSTEALGSLVLATGFCERHLDAKKVYSLAFLDEEFQESYWGKEDQEQKRREKIKEEINNLEYYMTLLEEV